jgi:hypothetical protein
MVPRYGQGSLAEVLPSVLAALGVPDSADPLRLAEVLAGVRGVAVLLVDGLGYHLLSRAAAVAPMLARALAGDGATLTELTSVFPSTTPAGLVSLGTGVAPGQHGVLGFTLNVPGTDRVLNHIAWTTDPDPARWQPVPTQFAKASAAGLAVRVVSRSAFAGSGLTAAAYRGAPFVGVDSVDGLVDRMVDGLSGGPALVYGYHAGLDAAAHEYGIDSASWLAAAADVDRLLARLVDGLPADTALLVTADHGGLDVPADQRFDLDTEPRLSAGVAVVAGEARVRYLHTRPGATDDVIAAWRGMLGAAAWVVGRDEAIEAGWYGPVPAVHRDRIGDVVVACRDGYAVLASKHEPAKVGELIAMHGSFTPVEMAIPLILFRGVRRSRGSVGGGG